MGAHGYGLGKSRTRLGRYLDQIGLTQGWLERHTGISEITISRLCGAVGYSPNEKTKMRIVSVLQDEIDTHVCVADFW